MAFTLKRRTTVSLLVLGGLALGGCGAADWSNPTREPASVCSEVGVTATEWDGDPNRRIEDMIEHLYGVNEDGPEGQERIEDRIDDPNFGGVYGDSAGGIVVAVLDCSQVDVQAVVSIAGGPDEVRIVEVEHTFPEVDSFRDTLLQQLWHAGVQGSVVINSTVDGRFIDVIVEDTSQLPAGFGSNVPRNAFDVFEGAVGGPSNQADSSRLGGWRW